MRCLACFAVLLYHEHFFHGSTFSLSNEPSYAAMRQTPVLGNFFLEISWHMTLLWLISGFLCERQLHQMLIRVQVRRRQQQQHNHRQQKQYYHQRQIAVQREEEPTKNSSNNTSSNDWISPAVSSREAKQHSGAGLSWRHYARFFSKGLLHLYPLYFLLATAVYKRHSGRPELPRTNAGNGTESL